MCHKWLKTSRLQTSRTIGRAVEGINWNLCAGAAKRSSVISTAAYSSCGSIIQMLLA